MIHTGDCVEVMAAMPADSVDAVVTDPPYGLEFMGVAWDSMREGGTPRSRNEWGDFGSREHPRGQHDAQRVALKKSRAFYDFSLAWGREALRVTKPGGYLLAFGGCRTHHRLVCGLEDAGWIIRDELTWVYASGFPKGKANLKPAHEPIVLARKPGPLRALNIDATRIPLEAPTRPLIKREPKNGADAGQFPTQGGFEVGETAQGRWPSNLLLSDPDLFDVANPGVVGSGAVAPSAGIYNRQIFGEREGPASIPLEGGAMYGDSGGYSRFFIVPKSDRGDREPTIRESTEGLYCNCKTVKPDGWERPDLSQLAPMASTSRRRATSEARSEDDNGSSTTLFGSSISDPSHQGSRSTTSTATSRTIESPTSSPSILSPISGSTPGQSSSTASGGSDARSAPPTDRSPRNGGTSAGRAGRSTGAADPAISPASSEISVCGDCGKPRSTAATGGADGVTRAARRNSHPT